MGNKIKYLIILLLTFVGHIYACDCQPVNTVKDEIKNSDIVIHGKVIKATIDTMLKYNPELDVNITVNEYIVLVLKKYKGKITSDTIVIRTDVDDEGCGLQLGVGADLIFYAYKITKKSYFFNKRLKNSFFTTNCTRTRFYNQTEQIEIEKVIGNR